MNVISTAAIFIVPESPKFLHSKKQYDKSRTVILYIARFNKVKMETFTFDEELPLMSRSTHKSALMMTQNDIDNGGEREVTMERSKPTIIKDASFIEVP